MTPGPPDLSVVIVTHNGREMALRTLRSARAADRGIEVEWIVVDCGSSDGTPEAIEREFSGVEVLRVPNRGFAAGNNAGISRAAGRYLLLLNPDIEIAQGTFAELLDSLEVRPEVGMASVIQRSGDGELQLSMRRFPTPARDLGESLLAARWPLLRSLQEVEVRPEAYCHEAAPDWVVGAFICARAEAVTDTGPMDERFFLYSEEIDWCLRARQAGWDVRHLPVMTVTHHGGGRDRGDLMAQLAHSRRLFAQKHHPRGRARRIQAALAVGHLLRIGGHLPLALRSSARRRIADERRALAVLLGLADPPLSALPAPPPEPKRIAERTLEPVGRQ